MNQHVSISVQKALLEAGMEPFVVLGLADFYNLSPDQRQLAHSSHLKCHAFVIGFLDRLFGMLNEDEFYQSRYSIEVLTSLTELRTLLETYPPLEHTALLPPCSKRLHQ